MKNNLQLIVHEDATHVVANPVGEPTITVRTIAFGIAEMPSVKAKIALRLGPTGFAREARLRVTESATRLTVYARIDHVQESKRTKFDLKKVVIPYMNMNIPIPRFLALVGFLATEWDNGTLKIER